MAYSVRTSGSVLSSLLYECANSRVDIEGFFLGVLSYKSTMAMDDTSEQAFERREDYIVIHGYQLLKQKPYDAQGNLNKSIMKAQQKDLSSIVGYFKFRRQSDVALSVRDQLWMKSYSQSIPHGCIAIISSRLNHATDASTQTYEFAFWDMKTPEAKLPLDITNMGEGTLAYQKFMSNAPYKTSDQSSNRPLLNLASADIISRQFEDMYHESMSSYKAAIDRVAEKEAQVAALRKEIQDLIAAS